MDSREDYLFALKHELEIYDHLQGKIVECDAMIEEMLNFMRINFRKGRVSAIRATARKLAMIIWNMVVKNVPYKNPEGYLFLDQKRKLGMVKRIKAQIAKFDLKPDDVGFGNSLIMNAQI